MISFLCTCIQSHTVIDAHNWLWGKLHCFKTQFCIVIYLKSISLLQYYTTLHVVCMSTCRSSIMMYRHVTLGYSHSIASPIFIQFMRHNLNDSFSPSHLEGSSTSVGRPGHCQSPVLAVENVDVRQRILFDVPPDGVHVS